MRKLKTMILNLSLKCFREPSRGKICVYLKMFKDNTSRMGLNVFFEDYRSIKIGTGSHINKSCKFYTGTNPPGDIIIGNNVSVAMETIFVTSTHEIGAANKRAGNAIQKSIVVGDGTWIGARSLILPGVSIGEGCIIQAGSVVSKNCKPNCIYGGNPAKLITDLSKISALM